MIKAGHPPTQKNDKMKKALHLITLLLLLALICVKDGLFFGRELRRSENAINAEPENPGAVKLAEAKRIFPRATELLPLDDGICEVRNADAALGFVLKSSPYSDKITGYMGPTPLLIGLDGKLVVVKVLALDNDETPSFFKRVKAAGLLEAWNGLTTKEAAHKEVAAVTGATFSSNAVIASMQARMAALENLELPTTAAVANGIAAELVFALFVAATLAAFFFSKQVGRWRWAIYAASILILAFWQDRFLSLGQFLAWLVDGVPLPAQWALALLFFLSIILPLLFGKAYYCSLVCPLGAAQTLLGELNKKHKLILPPKLLKALGVLRTVILWSVLLAVALGLTVDLASFEAFSVLYPFGAPKTALAIGLVSLLLSIFIPRPWCRFLCPLGEFLETFRRSRPSRNALAPSAPKTTEDENLPGNSSKQLPQPGEQQ